MNPISLGGRRELFVDDCLIEKLGPGAEFRPHRLERKEVVFSVDAPHEFTNASGYQSIVKDGSRYLLYYRAGGRYPGPAGMSASSDWKLCVIESNDGIHWNRPPLHIRPGGPNVVLDGEMTREVAPDPVCPAVTTVFKDSNPDCRPDEKFKMIVTNEGKDPGMYLFVSEDGFHFRCGSKKKFEVNSYYDSQNLAFFDPNIGKYRLYHRHYRFEPVETRTIRTNLTEDFTVFTDENDVQFDDDYSMQLYTNTIQPYFRAQHILLGFPMRYVNYDLRWDASLLSRPGFEHRVFRAFQQTPHDIRYGTVSTDTILISSRDGVHFKRHPEAILRPGPMTEGSWVYGDSSLFTGIIPTRSSLGFGAPDELSFYSNENYWENGPTRFRRCSIRMDGFVSIHFSAEGGEFLSKPFTFSGGRLELNIETSAWGFFQVEFLDENGHPVPGFSFEDSLPESCDALDAVPRWKERGADLRPLEGKTVRMKIRARDADLYSLCFAPFREDPAVGSPEEYAPKTSSTEGA